MIKVRFQYRMELSDMQVVGGINSIELKVKERVDAMMLVDALERVEGIMNAKAIDFFEPEVIAEFKAEEDLSPSEA